MELTLLQINFEMSRRHMQKGSYRMPGLYCFALQLFISMTSTRHLSGRVPLDLGLVWSRRTSPLNSLNRWWSFGIAATFSHCMLGLMPGCREDMGWVQFEEVGARAEKPWCALHLNRASRFCLAQVYHIRAAGELYELVDFSWNEAQRMYNVSRGGIHWILFSPEVALTLWAGVILQCSAIPWIPL